MKTFRRFGIILMIGSFISCKANKENNNIFLTDFTKELISLYINDIENLNAKNRKDEIILISSSDTYNYYLSAFANNSKEYKFCREDLVGQTLHLGHLIRVFGDKSSMFYSINKKINKQKRCKDNYIEYDPNVWQVCFYKDKSFCRMRTYKVTPNEDISEIQSLAEKYFKVSDTIFNEVYQSSEVENQPQFILGEDSLRKIISSNFKINKQGTFGKIPLVVGIIVDKKGKATLKGIIKSSNDNELDKEAIRVTEIICQYDFIPATHRGETVNANYSIMFFNEDIIP